VADRRASEHGAALLTVLLLVAVMAVIAAVALERLTLATRMAQNGVGADQARAMLLAGEQIAAYRIGDAIKASPEKTTLAGGWIGRELTLPVPGGTVDYRVTDADNCFNLNSLVVKGGADSFGQHDASAKKFAALLTALGVDPAQARVIVAATTDWIDSDTVPEAEGAEDPYYLQQPVPYRTAGGLIADPSELRAVKGMTAAIYSVLSPWVCALPEAAPAPVNINTLLPDQGIIITMLTGGKVSPAAARQVLAQRPKDGYASVAAFWAMSAFAGVEQPAQLAAQTSLASRWFQVDLRARLGETDVSATALFDAQNAPARLVRRRWGDDS
jgi:general secretion pathway protein K